MLSRLNTTIRQSVLAGDYVVTLHADEELRFARLGNNELREVLLNRRIAEKQLDEISGEWKHRLHGATKSGIEVAVICKLSPPQTVVIITVFRI